MESLLYNQSTPFPLSAPAAPPASQKASPGSHSPSLAPPTLFARPISQSASPTTRLVRSLPLLSSACSMVCVRIRASASKVNMNSPENDVAEGVEGDELSRGRGPERMVERPGLVSSDGGRWTGFCGEAVLLPVLLGGLLVALCFSSVFHRTTSFSSPSELPIPCSARDKYVYPVRVIFSERT